MKKARISAGLSAYRQIQLTIKEIEIQGCVTVPEEVSVDDFIDKFLAFIEENNWSFGGGYRTIIDGYYMNEDGTRGKHVLDA